MDNFMRRVVVLLAVLALSAGISGVAFADGGSATTQALSVEELPASADTVGLTKGLWVWHKRFIIDPLEQDELLAFCQRQGINLLMVQIHYPHGSEPVAIDQPQRYAELIGKAAELGIRVEALDGEKSMGLAENHGRSLAVLQAILELNATLPEGKRFSGIHYDIEPYLLDDWSDGARRTQIMSDLLDYFSKARELVREADPGMSFASDIPFWFDTDTSEDGLPLALEYAGQTKPIQQHIQDICDYVGIMSYRTKALGPNSITDIVEREVAYAEAIGKSVCAAVETIEYLPAPSISFNGRTADEFHEQFDLAWDTLAERPGFGGMLMHCYPQVREVLER